MTILTIIYRIILGLDYTTIFIFDSIAIYSIEKPHPGECGFIYYMSMS